jgi:hypothetical protein
MQRAHWPTAAGGLLILLSGCASGPHTTAGTAIGTGLGAVTGALIGSQGGDAASGAMIGAATGALAGGLVGNAEDARDERDAAVSQLHYERAAQHARALTNADLVMMAQNGVGDDVIINAINTRGGRFDLSPAAIIQLKNQGLSDRVLLSVQSAGSATPPVFVPAGPPVLVPPPVTQVVVAPRPAIGFGFMVGHHHHGYHHHGRRHRHRW